MTGMATLHKGNQELLVVTDKVGRPHVSLGYTNQANVICIHGGPETTVKLYTMHRTVDGGPHQCFDTVGWARGRGSGLQKNWMLVCW